MNSANEALVSKSKCITLDTLMASLDREAADGGAGEETKEGEGKQADAAQMAIGNNKQCQTATGTARGKPRNGS